MIDLHKEIMGMIKDIMFVPMPKDIKYSVVYEIATDILKLVNDNYISKEVFNNQYKEGKWR